MARRTPIHAELIERMDENDEAGLESDTQQFDADEVAAFNKFASEMSSSDQYAKINVYLQPEGADGRPQARKLTWLFEVGLDQLEFSQLMGRIRDEYGTGTYRLQGRDPTGALLFNRTFAVKAPERKPEKTEAPSTGVDLLAAFNKAMAEQQARSEALFTRLIAVNKQNDQNNMQGMQQFAVMLTMFKDIAGIFTGGAPAARAPSVLEELRKLTDLRDALKGLSGDGDGGGEKNIHDTISAAVTAFAPIITQAAMQQQAHAPRRLPRPMPPAQGPASPIPGATVETVAEEPQETQMQFSKQISILVMNAAAGIDPSAMADSILDMTADTQLESLRKFVEAPDCMAQMTAANPGVSKHFQWFQRLHAELLDYFKGQYLQDFPNASILSASDVPATPDAGNVNASDS